MSQKTHPIGFRINVPRNYDQKTSSEQGSLGYNPYSDLHGSTSRWSSAGYPGKLERYAELTQRDRVLKEVIEELLLEDGYLVNKCIITRTSGYVGVYVDVLRLSEPNVVAGVYGDEMKVLIEGKDAINERSKDIETKHIETKHIETKHIETKHIETKHIETKHIETKLNSILSGGLFSRTLERGLPVILQVYELNEITAILSEQGAPDSLSNSEGLGSEAQGEVNLTLGQQDIRNVLKLLKNSPAYPCSALLAKVIGYLMSGGRRHRDAMRVVMKELNSAMVELSSSSKSKVRRSNDIIEALKDPHPSAPHHSDSHHSYPAKLCGFTMILKGRIGGSERSRILRYRVGPMPRHTMSAPIDQGFFEVNTPSGTVSVTIMSYFN